ncbi:MAG: DUF378 domain-containing protein [bacterium]|nr:DUF378 domain-containing protein [bacterium]
MTGYGKGLHIVTFTLLVIGGVNWLLLAVFGWEVGSLFGGMDEPVSKIIYILVGLSAIYEVAIHGSHCRACKSDAGASAAPMNQ